MRIAAIWPRPRVVLWATVGGDELAENLPPVETGFIEFIQRGSCPRGRIADGFRLRRLYRALKCALDFLAERRLRRWVLGTSG